MTGCEQSSNAGAYVLGALDDADALAFSAHLDGCDSCRAEVSELRVVADTLPLAASPVAPPPALKGRIMAVVESEAQLLRAAGAGANRPPAQPIGRRRRAPRWALRPAFAMGGVALLLAIGVVGGVLLAADDGSGTRTISAQVAPAGANAALEVSGSEARIAVANMPAPPAGRVYQVWLVRDGGAPVPTHTLFTVPSDGRATVAIDAAVDDADAVWVTAEPSGGSAVPTSRPVIKARLS